MNKLFIRGRSVRLLRANGGFALLESLVAIVVVALGLIGILGMQLQTLADTQTGVRRAQAIRLIDDLSERIRANPGSLNPTVANNYLLSWDATPAQVSCAAGCTALAFAQSSLATWRQNLGNAIPGGNATVFFAGVDQATPNNYRQLGVMISWPAKEREVTEQTTAETTNYAAPFVLKGTAATAAAATQQVDCPSGQICHLQFIPLSMRCAPNNSDQATVAANNAFNCLQGVW